MKIPQVCMEVAMALDRIGRADAALELLMTQGEWEGMATGESVDMVAWLKSAVAFLVDQARYDWKKEFWECAIFDLESSMLGGDEKPYFWSSAIQEIGKMGGDEDSYTFVMFYPRYLKRENGDCEMLTLNHEMLKNTGFRCGHEHDCCGCQFGSSIAIEVYDDIQKGWFLSQNICRNI